jgi:hypothetical protein
LAYHIVTKQNEKQETLDSFLKQILFFLNQKLYFEVYDSQKDDVEENGIPFQDGDYDRAEELLRRLDRGETITMTEETVGKWV